MAGLVKTHGLPEIIRRLNVLERTPPKFPPTPWDMPTFSQHFDKIATAQRSTEPQRHNLPFLGKSGLRNGDLLELQMQRVAEAEARERDEEPS